MNQQNGTGNVCFRCLEEIFKIQIADVHAASFDK